MPPLEAPEDSTFRATLEFSGFPSAGVGVMTTGFWFVDTLETRDINDAALDIATILAAADPDDDNHERENRPSNSKIDLVRVSLPLATIFAPAPVEVALNVAGDQATQLFMPPDTAMVASLKTDYSGPALRGRLYWPHQHKDMLDATAALWDATACTRLNTTISAIRTGLEADDYVLACVSRFFVDTPNTAPQPRVPPIYAPVTSNFVDRHVDVQRRRGVR